MSKLPANFDLHIEGLVAFHNFPCPVCLNAIAVYNLNESIMEPCWPCQRAGYFIDRKEWWQFWKVKP